MSIKREDELGMGSHMLARDHMLSGGIIGARDIQSPHLVLQGGSLKPQAFCCAAIPGDSPGGAFQSIEDRLPLRLFECRG